jgi:receptor protein-tyrosine kinase
MKNTENATDIADRRPRGSMIGLLLVQQGKIKDRDIERILTYARKKNMRFGEAAVKLRLISSLDLDRAVATQFDYPYLEKGAGGYSAVGEKELVAAFSPFSEKGQTLRVLRAQLLLHGISTERHALAVVGSQPREGCSYIAANLAVTFSQLGQRTLLIDADLQYGRQHKLFGIKNDIGLSAALVGHASFESVTRKLSLFRDLSFIPCGAPVPNPNELLGRPELQTAFASLREHYEVVIFDTAPLVKAIGAELVASLCGSALVVVRKDHTRLREAEAMMQHLRNRGDIDILGSVMNLF